MNLSNFEHAAFALLMQIAIDQLANTVIGGWADETLSSRAWREERRRGIWSKLTVIRFRHIREH